MGTTTVTVTVKAIAGPDPIGFTYLLGEIDGAPAVAQVRSVSNASLAAGSTTIAAEVAALRADVDAAYANWQAAQAALAEL